MREVVSASPENDLTPLPYRMGIPEKHSPGTFERSWRG